jgi:hypothetical protein
MHCIPNPSSSNMVTNVMKVHHIYAIHIQLILSNSTSSLDVFKMSSWTFSVLSKLNTAYAAALALIIIQVSIGILYKAAQTSGKYVIQSECNKRKY